MSFVLEKQDTERSNQDNVSVSIFTKKKRMFAEKESLLSFDLQEEDEATELPAEDPDDEELSQEEDHDHEDDDDDDDWVKEG